MRDSESKQVFPQARAPTDQGLIAVGGKITADVLFEAYTKGIFPWPQESMPLLWFSPDPRGVLDFTDYHCSKSFLRWKRKNSSFRVTVNQAFSQVMKECRLQPRPGQSGTWILPEMEPAYLELQRRGFALSVEIWDSSELVGGIYGVLMENYFSGESMFHKRPNASKLALYHLIELLKARGMSWMDIQMVTPLLASFGGKLISRNEFLLRLGF